MVFPWLAKSANANYGSWSCIGIDNGFLRNWNFTKIEEKLVKKIKIQ